LAKLATAFTPTLSRKRERGNCAWRYGNFLLPRGLLAAGLAAIVVFATRAVAGEAAAPAPAADTLPPIVAAALRDAHIPPASTAFVVAPLDGGALRLELNSAAPMSPASTMKLVTTYAALGTLGPAYRWRTEVFAAREAKAGRLDGDLFLRGGGDPSLVAERWWLLVHRLRALGLREIRGDLVLDKSAFEPEAEAAATLDGNELRPYNVTPDALLVNFKTLSLQFLPDPRAGVARIVATPPLAGVRVPASVPLGSGPCGDWHARLQADFSDPWSPRLHGRYAAECGEQTWHLSLLGHDEYVGAAFRALWQAEGGVLTGSVREGRVPAEAQPLLTQESPPLAEVIRDINKFSNNVMARQLFLTIGAESTRLPAAPQRSADTIRAWLAADGLPLPELVLQNGSGLSREERISAAGLAQVLSHAWNSVHMPDFVASLPLAGVDGTMQHRFGAADSAYVKTGLLADVRAVAGYVFAASGRRYVVVAIINDRNAAGGQAAHDELLQWVWRNG
jgi:D-alanyl-D-alanine carboxypeptidase/D-alanyl-D-alanine-endopeptidase (penicillin-binding protein 4)